MDLRDMPHAGAYRVIYADWPWHFATHSAAGQGKSPSRHYRTLTVDQMIAQRWPVSQVAAPDAYLVTWSTFPHLAECFRLIESFSDPANPWVYVTGGAWGKRPRGWRGDPAKWQFGPGYLFRSAAELLLVFKRGQPRWLSTSERNFWDAPIREHSRKPEEVRDMLRRATEGPRLEMFSRDIAPGFDPWGDQVGLL